MKKLGLGLVVYGTEGIGKTSFALQFPKQLLCLSVKETGYDDLDMVGDVPEGCVNRYPRSYDDLFETLRAELEEPEFKTIVIDSALGIQQLGFAKICSEDYGGDIQKFNAYAEGPNKVAPMLFSKLESLLTQLRMKGVHVIIIGHAVLKTAPNAMGVDYLCYNLELADPIASIFKKWAQATLFMTIDVQTAQVVREVKREATVVKAVDTDTRFIYTERSPSHAAKNRLKLPPVIPMGSTAEEAFKNFRAKLPGVYAEMD